MKTLHSVNVEALSGRIKALPGRIVIFVGDRADQHRDEGTLLLPTSFLHQLGEETEGPYPLRLGVTLSSGIEGFNPGDMVGVLEHCSYLALDNQEYPWIPKEGEVRIYGCHKADVLSEVFKLVNQD